MADSNRKSGMLLKINQKLKSIENQSNSHSGSELDMSVIEDNPYQPRLKIDEAKLEELADSIKENGLIQAVPVAKFSKLGKDSYILIAGHRRVAAHKKLGLQTIKVNIFDDITEKDLASMALVENLQRDDLKVLEVAMQYKLLLNSKIFETVRELAVSIGRAESSVGKVLNLLNLPDDVLEDIKNNKSTSDIVALDAIRRVGDEKMSSELYFWFIKTHATREELLEKIKSLKLNSAKKVSHESDVLILKLKNIDTDSIKKLDSESIKRVGELLDEISSFLANIK
jgi:ParB family chromosome partitioning protein